MASQRARGFRKAARRILAAGAALAVLQTMGSSPAFSQSAAAGATPTTWTVTIVLPPRVAAGQPATLAVLGADGKLVHGVEVDLGQDVHVRTDPIGRAYFTVPSGGKYMIAKSAGASAAALVDESAPGAAAGGLRVPAAVSLRDTFSICGGGFRGDAEADRVTLGSEPALVLAASPECIVVLASANSAPGPAAVSVKTPDGERTSQTTLVSLRDQPPDPPLVAQKKSRLAVVADGATQPVLIRVENETPGVLRFTHDDVVLRTSGGTPNQAAIEVEAIRSGEYSIHARIIAPADLEVAQRYLNAAQPLAGKTLGKRLKKLAETLKRHPRNAGQVAIELDAILNVVVAGDLRTLLAAARSCL